MLKIGDTVRWYLNPNQYISGVVVEKCEDGTVWVEHNNGQQCHYKESVLSPELEICPFCKGEGELKKVYDFHHDLINAQVICKQCGASTKPFATIEGAIEAWNMRV